MSSPISPLSSTKDAMNSTMQHIADVERGKRLQLQFEKRVEELEAAKHELQKRVAALEAQLAMVEEKKRKQPAQ